MEENIEEGKGEKGLAGNIYELSFLFVSTITEEEIAAKFGELKLLVEKAGAVFIAEDMPRSIELAYQMSRTIANKKTWFERAYFGWLKFELKPEQLIGIKEVIARNEEIVRFLITRTVRESTLAVKRATGFRRPTARKADEPTHELTSEEKEKIDAEIDALVVEPEAAA